MGEKSHDKKYIAALDIGTTSIRCFIYDTSVQIIGKACEKVSYFRNTILYSSFEVNVIYSSYDDNLFGFYQD